MKFEPLDSPSVNTEELLNTITRFHEEYEEKDDSLNTSLLELYKFYTKKTDAEKATKTSEGKPRLYQYDPENQEDFDKAVFEISKELKYVYSVILFQKDRLDKTPSIETSQSQYGQESKPLTEEKKKDEEKEKKPSLLERIVGKQSVQTKEVRDSNRVTLQLIKDVQKVLDDWDSFNVFHSFGLDWVDEMDRFGIEEYMKIELVELKIRIPKLFRVIAQGRSLDLREERLDSKEILMASSKLAESHRKEQFFQQTP